MMWLTQSDTYSQVVDKLSRKQYTLIMDYFNALRKNILNSNVLAVSKNTGISRSRLYEFANGGQMLSDNISKLMDHFGLSITSKEQTRLITSESVVRALIENKSALNKGGISNITLFGSYARGDNKNDSDVDLLITLKSLKGLRSVAAAEDALFKALPGHRLDIVLSTSVSDRFLDAIRKDRIDVF